MSHTKEKEGTLRVLPLLKETTAYIVLRPFFKPKKVERPRSSEDPGYLEEFLSPENWMVSVLSLFSRGNSIRLILCLDPV